MTKNAYSFAASGIGAGRPIQTMVRNQSGPAPEQMQPPPIPLSSGLEGLCRKNANLFADLIRTSIVREHGIDAEQFIIKKLQSLNLL